MNAEHGFAAKFSSLSKISPLTDMSYENFAFFQFLGSRIGPIALIAMLRDMPTHPGRDFQLAALAAVPEMEATFEEFVRSVLDNTLIDSDGGPINIPVNYTTEFLFTDISSIGFPGSPFVVARYKVSFAGEKEFSVSSVPDGEAGRSGARGGGATGGWASIPESVRGCGELEYVLYVITTTPGAERKETVATTMVTANPCDECLFGRWEATNDSIISYMQSVAAAGGVNAPTVESATGTMFMEFEADSIGSGGYENLKVHETGVGGVASAEVFVTFDGVRKRTVYSGWLRPDRFERERHNIGHRANSQRGLLNHSPPAGGLPGWLSYSHPLHLRRRYSDDVAAYRGHHSRADRVQPHQPVDCRSFTQRRRFSAYTNLKRLPYSRC